MKLSPSKIFFIVSDVLIAVYLAFAFCSFDKKGGNHTQCNKVNIDIADNATSGFIDAKIIKDRLQKGGVYPMGKEICKVDARRIEEMLKASPFVQTADCYKTEGGHVYISVTQRMPVIRIKADNGDDYYVDDNDRVMPTTHYVSDLIIATGAINRWYATNFLSPLGRVIMANDVWKNLIEQINVLPNHSVEIVPRVGDHIVHLGRLPDGNRRTDHYTLIRKFMEVKMTRLLKFYKYGLSEVGWNKYSYIDIEFDNQIICRKKSAKHQAAAPVQPTAETTQPQNETTTTPNADTEKKTDKAANTDRTEKKSETKSEKKSEKTEKKSEKKSERKADKSDKSVKKTEKKTEKPQKAKTSKAGKA